MKYYAMKTPEGAILVESLSETAIQSVRKVTVNAQHWKRIEKIGYTVVPVRVTLEEITEQSPT